MDFSLDLLSVRERLSDLLAKAPVSVGDTVVNNGIELFRIDLSVLVKNPHFLKYIASKLVGKDLSNEAFYYEKKGYEITLKNLK